MGGIMKILFLLATIIFSSSTLFAQPTLIPDTNFKIVINDILGEPDNYEPTVADLNGVTGTVNAHSSHIESIEGAQYLVNITELDLSYNPLTSINPISNLSGLEVLTLYNTHVNSLVPLTGLTNLVELNIRDLATSDFTPIINLVQLEILTLYNVDLYNISGFEALTALEEFSLPCNNLVSIAPLSQLTNLQQLWLWDISGLSLAPLSSLLSLEYLRCTNGNGNDLASIANLTNLTTLDLSGNQLSDSNIAPLSDLVNLTSLYISSNMITDISALSNLTSLNWFSFYWNSISDLSPLSGLINLETLYAYGNEITDLSPLTQLPNLSYVNLRDNQITYLPQLSGMSNLQILDLRENSIVAIESGICSQSIEELDLNNNQITDIDNFGEFPSLTTLSLTANQIDSISSSLNFPNLEHLYIGSSCLSDINGLSNLTRLRELAISQSQITDITPLSNLTALEAIEFYHNQVEDISPLSNLLALEYLNLSHNQIHSITPLSNLVSLQYLALDNNIITDISPLSNLPMLSDLRLGNNHISDIYPLVENEELGSGDEIQFTYEYGYDVSNQYSAEAVNSHMHVLEQRGIQTDYRFCDINEDAACYPYPAREATDIPSTVTLEWQGGGNTGVAYNVYLGISPDNLFNYGFGTLTDDNIYALTVNLNPYQDYWWTVKTITINDTLQSGIWHFDTNVVQHLVPDVAFRSILNAELGENADHILTEDDLNSITGTVSFIGANIHSIEGAQYLTNINGLWLQCNQIDDLSPLSELENITSLDLWSNNITDIYPLVANENFNTNDVIYFNSYELTNPLSIEAIEIQIPILEERGIYLSYPSNPNLIVPCYPYPERGMRVPPYLTLSWQGALGDSIAYEVWAGDTRTNLSFIGNGVPQGEGIYSLFHFFIYEHEYFWKVKAVYGDEELWSGLWFFDTNTPASDQNNESPIDRTTLNSAYPNPFNPTTSIHFDVKNGEKGKLTIFNVKGQLLLSKEFLPVSISINSRPIRIIQRRKCCF
jgi:internalin A